MITREIIKNEIVTEENIKFDYNDKKTYLKRFDELQEKRKIKSENGFYSSEWIIVLAGVERRIIFLDKIFIARIAKYVNLSYEEFELGYRYYILEVSEKYSYIDSLNMEIKKFFNIQINSKNIYMKYDSNVINFLVFMNIDGIFEAEINEMLNNDQPEYKTRQLPSFMSIFKFIELLNKFEDEASEKELVQYYPILLWWKITSIIPQRPSEFLNIEFDCVREEEYKYFLTVKRSASKSREKIINRSNSKEYYKNDEIRISKEIYNFIISYKEFIMKYKININDKLVKLEYNAPRENKLLNKYIFTSNDLRYLLNKFFEEIIKKRYGFEVVNRWNNNDENDDSIERLVPYDSRHIAIINLIMMGNDYRTVMELAGHDSIKTTEGYYEHIEEYTNAYSIGYVKQLKKNILNEEQFLLDNKMNYGKMRFDELVGSKFRFDITGGICTYNLEKDRKPCLLVEGEHSKCNYFIMKDKEIIQKEIYKSKQKIKTETKILKEIIEGRKSLLQFDKKYSISMEKIRNEIKNLVTIEMKR